MKDISEMEKTIIDQLTNKLDKIIKVQNDVTKEMHTETVNNAPFAYNFEGDYKPSIQMSEVTEKNGIYTSCVYSNLLVGGKIEKWVDVPVSAFMEWGTGPLGEDTNTYNHEYPYTTDAPWNDDTRAQYQAIGTWGTTAKPHFFPALQKAIPKFTEGIKKVLKEWDYLYNLDLTKYLT